MKIHHSHTPLPDKLESSPTVGDIFRKHGEKYREEHGLHPSQHKVMYDMTLNTADAVSLAPTGRSVMPAAIWKKGYGHKPGQYDKSVRYDVPFFRCPSKGEFCKMLY